MAAKKKTNVKKQKNTAAKPGKENKKTKNNKNGKGNDFPSFAYQLIPYIVAVVALFFLICFIANAICNPGNELAGGSESEHTLGIVGFWICQIMFGLFGPAAYLIPVILACFVVFWRNYNSRDFVALNAVIAVLTSVVLSALFHAFMHLGGGAEGLTYEVAYLFEEGAASQGGGIIGGLLAFALAAIMNMGGTIFVLIAVLIPMVTFLVGTTPVAIVSAIAAKVKESMAKSAELRAEREKEEALEEKERREEERAERAAMREEERARRAEEREEARRQREEERAAQKEAREAERAAAAKDGSSSANNTNSSSEQSGLNTEALGDTAKESGEKQFGRASEKASNNDGNIRDSSMAGTRADASSSDDMSRSRDQRDRGARRFGDDVAEKRYNETVANAREDEEEYVEQMSAEEKPAEREEDKVKVKYSAFTVDEINRLDNIKPEGRKMPVVDNDDEDEDELAAAAVFSEKQNEEINSVDNANDVEEVVFTDPNDTGKRTRGYSTVDDMASDLFDGNDFEVDKETGEVFTPVVQDKGIKSADEYRAANEQKDEYFIGDKPEPEPIPEYVYPTIDLLDEGPSHYSTSPEEIEKNKELLRRVLADFKINVTDIACSCGPTITRYEVKPEAGTRVRQIANLVDDIAYGLAKSGIRIEAPIPGKAAVGIEVPNDKSVPVKLRTLIETPEFIGHKSKLAACLGADVSGKPVIFDIEKMPHLLVAGTTGSGKSVCINAILMSILYHAKPEEVQLLLIDPKKVEFKVYRDIPHLCCRIISDPKKAAGALNSAVNEMEKRFELIEEVGVRNIAGYNEATKNDPDKPYMPRLVIVIDEFADLMMTAKDEVETAVVRIAQKARAAGIHLIIGTQRPSVDVITGLIKANIPSRIAFTVMSGIDSRTILDTVGAEKLCGRGDMLYAPVGAQKPQRVQGAFVSDEEVETVVNYVKERNAPVRYNQEFESSIDIEAAKCGNAPEASGAAAGGGASSGGDEDTKFWDAVELAIDAGKISTSLLQRRLEVGYGRAAKIIDRMEEMGFVSAPDGNKPRKILITRDELEERRLAEE